MISPDSTQPPAARADGPAPQKRYGCKQCQNDFQHEPLTWSIGGIPARTFFFCSAACREAWMQPKVHPVADGVSLAPRRAQPRPFSKRELEDMRCEGCETLQVALTAALAEVATLTAENERYKRCWDVFDAGKTAALTGQLREANPHSSDSLDLRSERTCWDDGFSCCTNGKLRAEVATLRGANEALKDRVLTLGEKMMTDPKEKSLTAALAEVATLKEKNLKLIEVNEDLKDRVRTLTERITGC